MSFIRIPATFDQSLHPTPGLYRVAQVPEEQTLDRSFFRVRVCIAYFLRYGFWYLAGQQKASSDDFRCRTLASLPPAGRGCGLSLDASRLNGGSTAFLVHGTLEGHAFGVGLVVLDQCRCAVGRADDAPPCRGQGGR